MKAISSFVLAAACSLPLVVSAQPQCPPVSEITVPTRVLPAGEHVRVRAQWQTDWRGDISRVRLTLLEMSPELRRQVAREGGPVVVMPTLSPDLERAIVDAIKAQVECTPHPEGWTRANYPFVRQVKVVSG